jgi:hypothetical protein
VSTPAKKKEMVVDKGAQEYPKASSAPILSSATARLQTMRKAGGLAGKQYGINLVTQHTCLLRKFLL